MLSLVVSLTMLPETKGKSLEEISSEPSSPADRAAA
jgi:PHS family inorganic phosphate transporter-like MFS transporter